MQMWRNTLQPCAKKAVPTKHLNNIFNSEELDRTSTCSILEHMGNDGKQRYVTKYYNLDVILAVGYRVNSRNATFFRGKMTFLGIYIPVDTCCHYQFCFALQMRHSCISLEQKQNLP